MCGRLKLGMAMGRVWGGADVPIPKPDKKYHPQTRPNPHWGSYRGAPLGRDAPPNPPHTPLGILSGCILWVRCSNKLVSFPVYYCFYTIKQFNFMQYLKNREVVINNLSISLIKLSKTISNIKMISYSCRKSTSL